MPLKKVALKPYNLTPILSRAIIKLWSGNKKLKRKAQYVFQAMPGYQIAQTISQNAIGYDAKGKLMFLYLKGVISPRVRKRALQGLMNMEFKSCHKSGRPELRGAVAFNGHKNPEAGEFNTGYMRMFDEFKIKQSNQNLNQLHHMLPLFRAMDGIFARYLPLHFRVPNQKIKAAHRHGMSPFSTITFLRSAPSAVHVDGRNGSNLACMTTVAPSRGYTGGAFCFVEYGVQIKVQPGDLLIAATPKHWHANLTPVIGEKYSIICYFKDALRKKPV